VSLRDILTGRHEVKGPAPDRLFAIATAYVSLSAEQGINSTGRAAIVFQALQTADFQSALAETEELVGATGGESGTKVSNSEDEFGYRWMVFENGGGEAVEDLAVGINAVSGSIETAGHGERLLCAVFAFRDAQSRPLYLIYSYKRGTWYPFAPSGDKQRATERELQMKAKIGTELPIEPELERWFPLWGIPI